MIGSIPDEGYRQAVPTLPTPPRVDVGVVTNLSADHLGLRGIETVEDLARVKRVVIDAVNRRGTAVLNADDRLVAGMAASPSTGKGITSRSGSTPSASPARFSNIACRVLT